MVRRWLEGNGALSFCVRVSLTFCIYVALGIVWQYHFLRQRLTCVQKEQVSLMRNVKADEMRRSANLPKDSFLNLSEMQDFLMSQKIISRRESADVCGGYIMDSEHMSSFLNFLENASTKKTSAALYFHEHCVAILKVVLTDGTCCYDLIESMPQLDQNGKWAARTGQFRNTFSVVHMFQEKKNTLIRTPGLIFEEPRVFQAFVW